MGDQIVIGFSFASDWSRGWCEFSGPITERSKAKSMQSWFTFDTLLKIVLRANTYKITRELSSPENDPSSNAAISFLARNLREEVERKLIKHISFSIL